jgi:hypothetical protein
MIHLDLITRFFEFSYAHCDHHFLFISLKLLCDLSVKVICNKSSCIFENALSFIINRSLSMSLSKSRRRRRRMLELRWDVWTVITRSSQKDIWIFWSLIRECLKTSLNSFFIYLLTFSFEDHRTSKTSTVYDALFIFELCTSISKIRSFLFYEDNLSIRFYLFEFKRWLRSLIALFSWIFENILDDLFDDSMNCFFNDNDHSDLNSLNFANANFISDRWDEHFRINNNENQWVSICVWLSSFNDFFDSYVDCFIYRKQRYRSRIAASRDVTIVTWCD